jgi:GAF domain-containing protein
VSDVPAARLPYPPVTRFADLGRHLFTPDSVEEVLDRIVTAAVDLIDGADLASLSVLTAGGGIRTPAYTDPLALHLDEVQYDTGEGLLVDTAFGGHLPYLDAADLAASSEWPTFAPLAAGLGIRAVLSLGVFTSGSAGRQPARPAHWRTLGALNLYARRPHAFDRNAHDVGLLLAAHAAVALAATAQASQLREALRSRDVIGQAKGILMERRKLTADEAFEVLRETSQRLNIKLRDVAAWIADTGAEPPLY